MTDVSPSWREALEPEPASATAVFGEHLPAARRLFGVDHSPHASRRTFSFFATSAAAAALTTGAMITSTNCRSTILAAVAVSSSRLNAMMPPKADSESVAKASS